MKKQNAALGILAAASLLCLLSTPFLGASLIAPVDVLDSASADNLIFWRLRLPRSLGAFLAGSGLSLCGLAFQAMFRNPLATPFTLGVSSGAALGASIYFRLGIPLGFAGMAGGTFFAIAGSIFSMLLVYAITRGSRAFSTTVMLLAGVIINFLFSSLVMFVQYMSNAHDAVQIMRWLMGALSGIDQPSIWMLAITSFAALCFFGKLAPELDLLTMGEELAASRGMEVARIKLRLFLATSLAVGIIVSITGPIGFVGMMIPQICRIRLGYAHAALVPASFFLGGGFLTLCDLLSRTILAPADLPIGILTSMLGAPFFLWTLFRGQRAAGLD